MTSVNNPSYDIWLETSLKRPLDDVTSCCVLAVLPWIRWSGSFSLRTLLIAIKLAAAVPGLIVFADR